MLVPRHVPVGSVPGNIPCETSLTCSTLACDQGGREGGREGKGGREGGREREGGGRKGGREGERGGRKGREGGREGREGGREGREGAGNAPCETSLTCSTLVCG